MCRTDIATFSKLQFKTKPGAVCETFIVSVKPFKLLETRIYYNTDLQETDHNKSSGRNTSQRRLCLRSTTFR